MTNLDHARYCGDIEQYRDQVAEVRPHFDTMHLDLSSRLVWVRWVDPDLINHNSPIGQQVGNCWHQMPAVDFKLLVRV